MQSPRELGLPYDQWRTGQRLAIRTGVKPKTEHVIIQAPTGSGKSGIACGIAKLGAGRSAILTATNGLLSQYTNLVPWLVPIKGMRNYECLSALTEHKKHFRLVRHGSVINCDDGPCHAGESCLRKDSGCLYFDQRKAAMGSAYPLTNYAYWLAINRGPQGLGYVDRILCDEAHALPEELMAAYRIEIPRWLIKEKHPRTVQRWREWGAKISDQLDRQARAKDQEGARYQRLKETIGKLQGINETEWAWDTTEHSVNFEPCIPRLLLPALSQIPHPDDAKRYLTPPDQREKDWDGPHPKVTCQSKVYLSATITPATLTLLGLDAAAVTFHAMPSRFPVARRPLYLVDCIRVDHHMDDTKFAWWMRTIDEIIGKRLDRKGIIHTVSYARQQEILSASKHHGIMLAPRSAGELMQTIERFKTMPGPAILVSPSVTTGFDFPMETAEYQIIAKVPFPDTRSAMVSARIAATAGYREHLTMQTLVQTYGRIVRSDIDQGETFIVDNHASWFLKANADLAPSYFTEAIQRVKRAPPPLPKLRAA